MTIKTIQKTTTVLLPLALMCLPAAAFGQGCGSTGADGAYNPTASGVLDPVALKLNAAGDNVFNFTEINIPSGVTISMPAHVFKSQRPVVFLVSGAVNIQGTINISGASGQNAASQFFTRTPSEPGVGGYPGGAGGKSNGQGEVGAGPGGAKISSDGGDGCSASYTYVGTQSAACANTSSTYDNPLLLPLVGGSGGSGGGSVSANLTGPGGGAGGGAIRICSDDSITVNQLYANGGNGGTGGDTGTQGDGGAGSGGAIHLQSPTVTVNYYGGSYVQAIGGTQPYIGSGSVGRIRIDANILNGGGTNPAPLTGPFLSGSYGGVPLPTPPTLKVTSINKVAVPQQPNNSYTMPDVTTTATGNIPIVIATTNVPNNTTATFYISTDSTFSPGVADIVQTAVITNNAATLNVTIPTGVNRIFVRAVF